MRVSKYVIEYTSGDRILFKHILSEAKEMLDEVVILNWRGMNEEWQDVLHFVQLWLYWRFKIDDEIWDCTKDSVKKFMDRVAVWHDIYEYVGLPRNTSNFCGNYNRKEKVIMQLARYNIDSGLAEEAYARIVKI